MHEQQETGKSAAKAIPSWTVMRFVVAAIILTAAFMKAHQLATTPSLGEGLLHARWFNILVVEFELFFGIWLIFGMLPKLTWLVTVGCFSTFAMVSLYKAISGEASCGCFGSATINPWITTVFDLAMIGALAVFRPKGFHLQRIDLIWDFAEGILKKRIIAIALLWLLLAVPATYAMVSVKTFDIAELGMEFIGLDGRKTILLEPEKWVGKEWPLLSHLEPAASVEKMRGGQWTVLLYHHDCSKCSQTMEHLSESQEPNVLCIEVPPFAESQDKSKGFEYARLGGKRKWFVDTPILLKTSDRIVEEVIGPDN